MDNNHLSILVAELETELADKVRPTAILGCTDVTFKLLRALAQSGLTNAIVGIYSSKQKVIGSKIGGVPLFPIEELRESNAEIIVIASDREKEQLLEEALPFIRGTPKVILAGYAHHQFHNRTFEDIQAQLLVPSFANGYPNSLIHIFQCLENAARLELEGVIVEFGMFKGGTTKFITKLVKHLHRSWQVIGFDTFNGFPPKRSPLDMYDHPGCIFKDLQAVQDYFRNDNVSIVDGDIVETCHQLKGKELILSFIDTDNYTSAMAALSIVKEQTVVHGAIIFDHFTGVDRFKYTLGEKMAAKTLLNDPRYFCLHGTGVFYRQK